VGDAIQCRLISGRHIKNGVMGNDESRRTMSAVYMSRGASGKAPQLTNGLAGYGLVGEAVTPGFDFADMELVGQQHTE
jgi:predicted cupin superfamily sugar epimerase